MAAIVPLTLSLLAGSPVVADEASDPTAPPVSRETDLGLPVPPDILSFTQTMGVDPNGRPQAYFVADGAGNYLAEFAALDLRSGELVFDQRVPVGIRQKAIDFSDADGSVYFGMRTGELYRYQPGPQTLELLGAPMPAPPGVDMPADMGDNDGIYSIDAGDDGMVYGGTYPGGRVFSYDPQTGAVRDYGQLHPEETYVQSVVQVGDFLYAGTQPHGRVFRVDITTGAISDIPLPSDLAPLAKAVWRLQHVSAPAVGEFLFAWEQANNVLLVYDLQAGQWVDVVRDFQPQTVSPLDPRTGQHVYFGLRTGNRPMVRYDLATLDYEPINWTARSATGWFRWVDVTGRVDPQGVAYLGPTLAYTTNGGGVYLHDFTSGAGEYQQADLQGAPHDVNSVAAGPSGDIFVGLYATPPGMARLDPDTASFQLLRGSGQVEGFGNHGETTLVFGRYPNAQLYAFDTSRAWQPGINPPDPLPIGDQQDRPVALRSLDAGTVAVGSVPVSGQLDGALSLWDPATDQLSVHRGFLDDHSPVSLAVHDGLIYGGTSVWGGIGVDPTQPSGLLFVYDPQTRSVLYAEPVVPGEPVVSALTVGPDGNVWGLADNWLFTFDPDSRQILRRQPLVPEGYAWDQDRWARYRGLVFDEVGRLYVTTSDRLLQVHPVTWEAEVLAEGSVRFLAMDRYGDLYFSRGVNLVRYDVPPPTCPEPDDRTSVVVGGVSTSVDNRFADDGCTINDLILDEQSWPNHGAFVTHVDDVTQWLMGEGIIDGREKGEITSAAARSPVPAR